MLKLQRDGNDLKFYTSEFKKSLISVKSGILRGWIVQFLRLSLRSYAIAFRCFGRSISKKVDAVMANPDSGLLLNHLNDVFW